jgi:hypothetical protein
MARERKNEDAATWQRRIDAWRDSGLSITQFVTQESLPRSTFLKWRKVLGAPMRTSRGGRPLVAPSLPVAAKSTAATAVTFVEVTAPTALQASSGYGVPFEVGLRSGRRLQVPAGFDPDALERLLAILEVR